MDQKNVPSAVGEKYWLNGKNVIQGTVPGTQNVERSSSDVPFSFACIFFPFHFSPNLTVWPYFPRGGGGGGVFSNFKTPADLTLKNTSLIP